MEGDVSLNSSLKTKICNGCDIIQNYGLLGCDLVQYLTSTFRMQLPSTASGLKTLKVDIAVSSGPLVCIYHITRRHIPRNRNVYTHHHADFMKFPKTSQTKHFIHDAAEGATLLLTEGSYSCWKEIQTYVRMYVCMY